MRIVELGDCVEAAKAAKTLLQLGNDVIKIEDTARRQSLRDQLSAEGNPLLHLALDAGKQSVGLDFQHPEASTIAAAILSRCDGAVVATGDGVAFWRRIAAEADRPLPPALVFDEPAPGYDGYAMTGHMVAYGDIERPPLPGPPALPALFTGVAGVIAFYAALLRGSGEAHAQTTRTMAALYPKSVGDASYRGLDAMRGGRSPRGYHPAANYRCSDGFVSLLPLSDEKSLILLELAGHPEATTDGRFTTNPARLANYVEYDALLAPWLLAHTRDEVVAACQAHGIPSGSLQSVSDYLDDRQPADRRFFHVAQDERGRTYRVPGLPDGRGSPAVTRTVPAFGAHTREVLSTVCELDDAQIERLFASGVVA